MIYLRQPKGIGKTKVYMEVSHNGHPTVCDACHMQGDCQELFANGDACPTIGKGNRWHIVTEEDIKHIIKAMEVS